MEVEDFNVKAFFLFIGIGVVLAVCSGFLHDWNVKRDYQHTIIIEQSRKNKKIAEEIIAKELNVDNEHFQMTAVPINILNRSYWKNKDLVSEVDKDGKGYTIYFETKIVRSIDNEIEMYEPVGISKIVKKE
ncbi:hypothetical protein ACPA2L_25290 [Bacillus bombysepticus]